MCDLLPLETSFEHPRLTLGYRALSTQSRGPLGPPATQYRGHEFHFASTLTLGEGESLFSCSDARNQALGATGLHCANVMGSFVHLVDRVSETLDVLES